METPRHERLRDAIGERTNREVARALGVRDSTVSEWVNGRKDPSLQNFIDLAEYLRVTMDYLAGRVDDPTERYRSDEATHDLEAIRGVLARSAAEPVIPERAWGAAQAAIAAARGVRPPSGEGSQRLRPESGSRMSDEDRGRRRAKGSS